jgi:type IV pilus biogenesis protein CpaD/CtpE
MRIPMNKPRVPYARALYAAAVAVLLSACARIDSTPAARTAPEMTSEVADNTEMPVVIVTASREQPKHIG